MNLFTYRIISGILGYLFLGLTLKMSSISQRKCSKTSSLVNIEFIVEWYKRETRIKMWVLNLFLRSLFCLHCLQRNEIFWSSQNKSLIFRFYTDRKFINFNAATKWSNEKKNFYTNIINRSILVALRIFRSAKAFDILLD